ncbi:MAG TPA: tetratricopeptide repeat protein [Phycisphaeraceae bacterium]
MRCTRIIPIAWAAAAAVIGGCQGLNPAAQREENVQVLMAEAEVFLQQGLTDSALAAFGLALEENPRLLEAHLGMGHIYRSRGDYDLASRAYERAVETDPNSFQAHYYLALVRQLMGQIEEAVRIYLRALTINPDSLEANRDLSSAYLQLGQAAQAIPYALRATQIDPDNQAAWCNLAAAYSLTGQYAQAVDAYRQAAELGELADPVLLGLADAHIHLDNYQQAINVLELLIRRSPSSTAHERLGLALFKMRRFEEALAQYRQAQQLDAQDTAALNGVGVCLMTLYLQGNREDHSLRDEALEAWRQSLLLEPDQPRIIDLLARFGR